MIAKNHKRAFTLIEAILYIVLLSMLMSGLIQYIYGITLSNEKLNNDIKNEYSRESGFGALIAVLLLSSGMLSFCIVTASYSHSYADFVNRRELRLQASLNAKSCIDNVENILRQDPFLVGKISLQEFGCEVDVRLISGYIGSTVVTYRIEAIAKLEYVRSYLTREVVF